MECDSDMTHLKRGVGVRRTFADGIGLVDCRQNDDCLRAQDKKKPAA
jgi:hypothetical protein